MTSSKEYSLDAAARLAQAEKERDEARAELAAAKVDWLAELACAALAHEETLREDTRHVKERDEAQTAYRDLRVMWDASGSGNLVSDLHAERECAERAEAEQKHTADLLSQAQQIITSVSADNAALRAGLEAMRKLFEDRDYKAPDGIPESGLVIDEVLERRARALLASPSPGAGWVSPEKYKAAVDEYERLVAINGTNAQYASEQRLRAEMAEAERDARPSPEVVAEMRELLERERDACGCWNSCDWVEGTCQRCNITTARYLELDAALAKLPKGGG